MSLYERKHSLLISKVYEIKDLISSIDKVRGEVIDLAHRTYTDSLPFGIITDELMKVKSQFVPICIDSMDVLNELINKCIYLHDMLEFEFSVYKAFNANMGGKSDSATIDKLHVSRNCGTGLYFVIELNGFDISFCYRILPHVAPRYANGKGHFDKITVKLTDDQLVELMAQVNSIDYESWESCDAIYDPVPRCGATYQSFHCDYSDGSFFEFKTDSKPPDSFIKMFDVLDKYCDWSLLQMDTLCI